MVFGSPTKSDQPLHQATSSPNPVPRSLISFHRVHKRVFPPTSHAVPRRDVCFHTDSVLHPSPSHHSSPRLKTMETAHKKKPDTMRKQGGFWCSAQAGSKFRFSGGVTAHPGSPVLPRSSCFTFPSPSGEAQAGCGQQVLCVGNRRPACCRAWCSAWHCPKLPGWHWSLPGGAEKGCSAFASGAGSSFSGGVLCSPFPLLGGMDVL